MGQGRREFRRPFCLLNALNCSDLGTAEDLLLVGVGQQRGLQADRGADGLEEQVAVAQQAFGTVFTEQHAGLGGLTHPESDAGRDVGVERALDGVAAGLLGGKDQVKAIAKGMIEKL